MQIRFQESYNVKLIEQYSQGTRCSISSTLVDNKRRLTSVLSFTAMLDCHCAGRPFRRIPLLINMQHWANSIQKSPRQPLVCGWLATPEMLMMFNRHCSKYREIRAGVNKNTAKDLDRLLPATRSL